MHGESLFIQALLYLVAAVIAVPIAKRLGLGSVLGYLLAGIAIGPFGLGLLGEERQDVMHFAEFGVVMMLFLVGLELQPRRLWEMRVPVLGMGGAQVGVTAVVIAAIALGFGQSWQAALAIGLTLALSSTAIVLQSLKEKGLLRTEGGQSSFAVLLLQDIAVIPMLAVFPMLAVHRVARGDDHGDGHGGGHDQTWLESLHLPGWAETLVVLGAVAAVIVAGQLLARPFLRFVAGTRLQETFTAAALLLVIGIALLMSRVGLSPALGTFLAGVVLANSEYRHELEGNIEPFKGLLLGVFFVAVGASIDFALVAAQGGSIGAMVAALIVAKLLILMALGRVFRLRLDQNLLFSFTLAQGGEFAFVLLSFAKQSGVLTTEQTGPLVAAVALSMAATPVLMILNERLILPRFGTKEEADREPDEVDQESAVLVAGFGEFGGTTVRFLRANGVQPTVLETDSDRVELLRRLGLKAYYGDARRHELLHSAGAEDARLLVVAVGDLERTLELVHMACRHFPHLTILARAADWFDAFELVKAGVDHVYRHNADTAVAAGGDVLRQLGRRGHQVHRAGRRFLRLDGEAMRELAEAWGDDERYFSEAREYIARLEEIMLAEMEGDEVRDAGWDTDSLRQDFRDRHVGDV
jgi:monovalent cation:proton antiporter-2 (CPA2) family protein